MYNIAWLNKATKTSKDVERLSVPGNASDQLQECETSITQLSQMSALLQKYQNIQNYYMSWTSRGTFKCSERSGNTDCKC